VRTVSIVALYVAAAAGVLVLLSLVLIRAANGRHARALVAKAARRPRLRRLVIRPYLRNLEKKNPLAARAYAKLERASGSGALRHGTNALSVLTEAERRAYLRLFEDEADPLNRAQRRRAARREQKHYP
jgi:hypothetical protein